MQPHLGLPGALVGAPGRSAGRRRGVAVVPGRLDQQPAGVAVAGQGDVAAVLLGAAGVLAGGDARARQRARADELKRAKSPISAISPSAVSVRSRESAQQAAPGRSTRSPAAICSRLGVERGQLALEPVQMDQHAAQAPLRERVVKALAGQPSARCSCVQRLLPSRKIAAVAQQLLEHAVARRCPRAPQVIAAAQQVPQPLRLGASAGARSAAGRRARARRASWRRGDRS